MSLSASAFVRNTTEIALDRQASGTHVLQIGSHAVGSDSGGQITVYFHARADLIRLGDAIEVHLDQPLPPCAVALRVREYCEARITKLAAARDQLGGRELNESLEAALERAAGELRHVLELLATMPTGGPGSDEALEGGTP